MNYVNELSQRPHPLEPLRCELDIQRGVAVLLAKTLLHNHRPPKERPLPHPLQWQTKRVAARLGNKRAGTSVRELGSCAGAGVAVERLRQAGLALGRSDIQSVLPPTASAPWLCSLYRLVSSAGLGGAASAACATAASTILISCCSAVRSKPTAEAYYAR